MWFLLLGCEAGVGGAGAGIDTTDLFTAEDGDFSAFRQFTGDAYAEADTESLLDETNLLFGRFGLAGCSSGDGWRFELRRGGEWNTATPVGAIHLDNSAGLAICGYEDAAAALSAFDPPAALWIDGQPLNEGETVVSGDWSVTPSREAELSTYFGEFSNAAVFTIAGPGEMDGWVLSMAARYGIVLMANSEYTADLVYSR